MNICFANDALCDGLQYLSTEAKDLDSLAPVNSHWPGVFLVSNFVCNALIPPRVSKAQRVRGGETSDQPTHS
jgi:hypothetical protein